MSAATLIATHLNTPYGRVVAVDDVCTSLLNGRLSATTELANTVLSCMFCEIDPQLIARCAMECKASMAQANLLYQDTLNHGAQRSPTWESAMEHFL